MSASWDAITGYCLGYSLVIRQAGLGWRWEVVTPNSIKGQSLTATAAMNAAEAATIQHYKEYRQA